MYTLVRTTLIALMLSSVALSQALLAQDYSTVSAAVSKLIPAAKDIAIAETPIPGILEVQVNGDILYFSEDGKYLLQGKLFDLDARQDLTETARAKIRNELLAEVSPAEQITFAPNDPEHDVIVFTDVDCGYCRKLHEQIDEYNDQGIAVHYMMYPRAGIPSEAYNKMVSLWCSADQKTALTETKRGETLPRRECENPVASQYELGKKIGMTGTPAIVTSNGVLIPGYVPPADLRQRLDALQAQASAE